MLGYGPIFNRMPAGLSPTQVGLRVFIAATSVAGKRRSASKAGYILYRRFGAAPSRQAAKAAPTKPQSPTFVGLHTGESWPCSMHPALPSKSVFDLGGSGEGGRSAGRVEPHAGGASCTCCCDLGRRPLPQQPLYCGDDDRVAAGDDHGMFVLRHQAAVLGAQGPAVALLADAAAPQREDRLDGQHQALG